MYLEKLSNIYYILDDFSPFLFKDVSSDLAKKKKKKLQHCVSLDPRVDDTQKEACSFGTWL